MVLLDGDGEGEIFVVFFEGVGEEVGFEEFFEVEVFFGVDFAEVAVEELVAVGLAFEGFEVDS